MEGWVAVTHHGWFDFLSRRKTWEEVNFWTPSDHYAFNGTPGTPFLFKLKAPRNAIGGFGFFSRFDRLPEWLAWECFREGNGAPTLEDMQSRLTDIRLRNHMAARAGLIQIGCIEPSGDLQTRHPSGDAADHSDGLRRSFTALQN